MAKILKNNTGSDIEITDTGITVVASGQYTIPAQDYLLWTASSNIVTEVGSGDITVNDGSSDLSISDGIDIIKGIFPTTIEIANSFETSVATGAYSDCSRVSLTGYNSSIGSSFETVWRKGGIYLFPSSADTLDVRSSDSDDTLAGTGAKVILIEGLDVNYDEISETVNMNGTSNVTTTQEFLRVNRALVVAAGSQNKNDGDITIEHTGSNADLCRIEDGDSVSQSAVYTVPAGKTAYIFAGFLTVERNRVKAELIQKTSNGIEYKLLIMETGDQGFTFNPPIPLPISEKSDIVIDAKLNSGSGGITAGFTILLKDN